MEPLILQALNNKPLKRPPVWLMRQAGRYMKEYRELKEKYSFLELCNTPELAFEVTMQPIKTFDMDAAIVFADILLPFSEMGVKIDFNPGPHVANKVSSPADIKNLITAEISAKDNSTCQTLAMLREAFESDSRTRKGVLGFAGAPWTLACYLVDQGVMKHFQGTQVFAEQHPEAFLELLDKLTTVVSSFLLAQLESGADAVQLFDSWGGNLNTTDYQKWSLPFIKKVINKVHSKDKKVILYVGNSSHLLSLLAESGADCISVDWRISLPQAASAFGNQIAVQGNLDPSHLYRSPEQVKAATREMLATWPRNSGYIANLGHGILPTTPPKNVKAFVETIKNG